MRTQENEEGFQEAFSFPLFPSPGSRLLTLPPLLLLLFFSSSPAFTSQFIFVLPFTSVLSPNLLFSSLVVFSFSLSSFLVLPLVLFIFFLFPRPLSLLLLYYSPPYPADQESSSSLSSSSPSPPPPPDFHILHISLVKKDARPELTRCTGMQSPL